jgi:AcrR family transcriptional regulator
MKPERRTQESRRAEAEQALLDAAAELIAERGIARTTFAAIGERAGYSRGLVTHHFGSKDALVERLVRRSHAAFADTLRAASDSPRTGREDLLEIVDLCLTPREGRVGGVLLVMWGEAVPTDADTRAMRDADRRARAGIARCIDKGRRDGTVPGTVDGEVFAVARLGAMRGVAIQHRMDRRGVDLAAARAMVRAFVLGALETAGRS